MPERRGRDPPADTSRTCIDPRGQGHGGVLRVWRNLLGPHASSPPRRPSKPARDGAASPSRLGASHLGKFADEKEMPRWLARALDKHGQVCTAALLPLLDQLLQQCPSTKLAYLCHPCVQHVSKLRREGGFCGYRNIQALVSYIIGAHASGVEHFGDNLPTVSKLQDLIEHAWDEGHNPHGRIETGGIKGTRKYIGTPEAQALFCSLDISCSVQVFRESERRRAGTDLLQAVEEYFQHGWKGRSSAKVRSTKLPPVYLQHQGHSVTIVGIERQQDGQGYLLVFDPSARDSNIMKRLVGRKIEQGMPRVSQLLEPYRRGTKYLSKHAEFEILW